MTIYDELVASSSQLYGSEKAVETEQKMLEMRQKEMAYRQGRARERKSTFNSRIASVLGLLSQGYHEVKNTLELNKKGRIMTADPEFGVTKEDWDKMDADTKNKYWYDYTQKNKTWYQAWQNTPLMNYGKPTITPYTSNYQTALYR